MQAKGIQLAAAVVLLGGAWANAVEVPADVLFARKIQPLFKVKCLTCHGDNQFIISQVTPVYIAVKNPNL